jgi:hypothetical protein
MDKILTPEIAADFARKFGSDKILILIERQIKNEYMTGKKATCITWNNDYEDDKFMQALQEGVAELFKRLLDMWKDLHLITGEGLHLLKHIKKIERSIVFLGRNGLLHFGWNHPKWVQELLK